MHVQDPSRLCISTLLCTLSKSRFLVYLHCTVLCVGTYCAVCFTQGGAFVANLDDFFAADGFSPSYWGWVRLMNACNVFFVISNLPCSEQ